VISDFEDYDGATEAVDWTFSFNEDGAGFAGFWAHTDEDPVADYTLSFVAGANDSTYALSAQDPEAAEWGGGIAFYLSCLDASAYSGIEFMVKGSTPAGSFNVSIVGENAQAFSTGDLTISSDWTALQVPWSSFTPDAGSTATSTNGGGIGSLTFNAHLMWALDPEATEETWVATPGPFELTIDDLAFY
jgi:hypothetical protein